MRGGLSKSGTPDPWRTKPGSEPKTVSELDKQTRGWGSGGGLDEHSNYPNDYVPHYTLYVLCNQ